MSIYRYKLASENIRTLFMYLDLFINCVPNFVNDCTFGSFGGSQSDATESHK